MSGLLSLVTVYVLGRHSDGWRCRTCGGEFFSKGKPRRVFLGFLDHAVLGHRRLPSYGPDTLRLERTYKLASAYNLTTSTSANVVWSYRR